MARICLLLMRLPRSDEEAERMYGMAHHAKEQGMDVEIYLLGDGVFCAKKGQKQNIRTALEKGIFVRASAKDLRARAISKEQVEPRVEIIEDLESIFVEDIMEKADRVISW
ncbi:MAG: DsrH/TusB family sulfur metabolism protein [Nitrososphaerales archaeon]